MDHDRQEPGHRDFEDQLAAAALGVLEPEAHRALMEHLRTCHSCQAALGRLQSAVDTLPLAVEPAAPSAALRDRLRAATRATPQGQPRPTPAAAPESPIAPLPVTPDRDAFMPLQLPEPEPRRWTSRLAWLAAALALLVLGVAAGILVDRLVLQDDDEAAPQELAVQSPTGLDLEGVSLVYLEDEGVVRFAGSTLPALPEGQVYQVWLLGEGGAAPDAAGTIDPVTGQFAAVPDLDRHRILAITVEPGPLGSTAPSSEPVIMAALPGGPGLPAATDAPDEQPPAQAPGATPPAAPAATPAASPVVSPAATPQVTPTPEPTDPAADAIIEPPAPASRPVGDTAPTEPPPASA